MKNFPDIYKAYYDSCSYFARKEANAKTPKSRDKWARKSELNDYAYFVLFFSQLEEYVNEQCKKLRLAKLATKSWKKKRLWDTTKLDRLQFMRKVALLTKKGQSLYNSINYYYDIRCKIAHGDSSPGMPIYIPNVINEFKSFKKSLKA